MRNPLWKLLQYLPLSVQTALKRHTSERFRMWLRLHAGASPMAIADEIRQVPDGRRFHIGPDWIYWALAMGMEFEPELSTVVRKLVGDGETIVDVGANFGWYATLFAQQAGPCGKVIAFEPVPSTLARLRENLELNRLSDRVTTVQSAVGSACGEATIYVFDKLSHSCASLSRLGESEYRATPTPVVTLDSYIDAQRLERVDFLKCDVEGSELSVLQGAARLLSRPDAPIVLIELNSNTSRSFGYEKQDVWRALKSAGYDEFYHVASSKKLVPVDSERQLGAMDALLCAKHGRIAERLKVGLSARRAA